MVYTISTLMQDGRMLDATPPKQSATGVNLNAVTRKAGGRKQVEKQMQVIGFLIETHNHNWLLN